MGTLNKETQDYIIAHIHEDVKKLALQSAKSGVDLHSALQQIEGYQTAAKKLPSWTKHTGIIYPPRISMEQCSSEKTAIYKQNVVKRILTENASDGDGIFMDLTGGFGIDFSFIAPLFKHAVYMERQEHLCQIAKHNFNLLGLSHAEILNIDSSAHPASWPNAICCYIDPARRDQQGQKTIAIEDCEPNLIELQQHLQDKAEHCLIKLSPMLDIQKAIRSLKNIAEVHAVSVQNECKELLLVINRKSPEEITFHCVNIDTLTTDFTFTRAEEDATDCHIANQLGHFLYEPNASIMKCGGFKTLATRYRLKKLHPHSHLYTSDERIDNFPGRTFSIVSEYGFGKQDLKNLQSKVKQANLTIRNFPSTVADLRKRLKLKEGGEYYLFATTTIDEKHILILCRKA